MQQNELPHPPNFMKMIGPSIILLGLGLGSGELILWPYLVSNFGLGIIWAAVVGIGMQFFINMEIERYSLIYGESVFAGFSKQKKFFPYWFIFSTFIAWVWPGIIATSAKVLSEVFNLQNPDYVGIALLIIIGLILTLGPKLYKTVETFQKYLILIGVPMIALIAFFVAKGSDFKALGEGVVGIGNGYLFIPSGIPLFTLLGALAYSGAGGNLNLAQSFYIKEKGYGMCRGSVGITSVLKGESPQAKIFSKPMDFLSQRNLSRFRKWWRLVNLEHFLVFFVTGALTILLLALLSYASSYGIASNQGVNFLIVEASSISEILNRSFATVFLVIVALMLFATQLTVLDSTSRIISENLVILKKKFNLSKIYYLILWLQIIASIIIFSFGYFDPITLVVTSAVINALAMAFHIGATFYLNKKSLPKEYQPSLIRKVILFVAFLVFIVLFIFALINAL